MAISAALDQCSDIPCAQLHPCPALPCPALPASFPSGYEGGSHTHPFPVPPAAHGRARACAGTGSCRIISSCCCKEAMQRPTGLCALRDIRPRSISILILILERVRPGSTRLGQAGPGGTSTARAVQPARAT